MINNRLDQSSSFRNQIKEPILSQCQICGIPAQYSYFGVMSCSACKMFFKRNANTKQKVFKCDFDGHCEISFTTVHKCSSCRLDKCFKYGMTTEKFRPSRLHSIKTISSVKLRSHQQLKRLPTLSLLQSDRSLLTTNQWCLLSNLYNIYKEDEVLSLGQNLTNAHHFPITYGTYQTYVDKFLASIYETTGAYLQLNDDLRQLSYDQRSLILRNAADNVACMTGVFAMQKCHLYHFNAFSDVMERKYGKRTIDIHRWAMKFIDNDIVIVKLAMGLFAVSENTCSYSPNVPIDLSNSMIMFEIQNKYAELIWKYLVYRCGDYDAIKRFLNVILWLRAIGVLTYHAQTLMPHVNDVDSLIEEIELKLLLDDVDEIVEVE